MRCGSSRPCVDRDAWTLHNWRGRWLILHGMEADDPMEPDVASLFAPVAVEETFAGVLTEARQVRATWTTRWTPSSGDPT